MRWQKSLRNSCFRDICQTERLPGVVLAPSGSSGQRTLANSEDNSESASVEFAMMRDVNIVLELDDRMIASP